MLAETYKSLRRSGYRATEAYHNARISERWQSLSRLGLVRIVERPDETPYDDSYLECQGLDEHTIERERKDIWRRIGQWGVVGLVAQYRTSEDSEWVDADSIWGFIGDEADASGYRYGLMDEAMGALREALMDRCPLCRKPHAED